MAHLFKINNVDAATYGLMFLQGTYKELLKLAKRKPGVETNWNDENGTERDDEQTVFESRILNIPVLLKGNDTADYIAKLQAFKELIETAGYFNFKAYGINRQYTLLYSDVSNWQDYGSIASFNLVLIDDYPATITPID
ncbi:hypothetical protein FW774_17345 [Pedobacter sp. BS3]|uniref:hypothetical protein n=1 Tax=Pedobacter sp. BS3 TaxID=2567937 RepID=UPI0011EBD47D|nr:hypothetical protein [Pedobacter sp. BS3]TZF81821.1 hypothetical protein FW774_17345 [Pedobacter sp. BS3]